MNRYLTYLAIIGLLVGCLVIGIILEAAFKRALAADTCMTLTEARAKYPTAHLYKRQGCWDVGKLRPRKVKPAPLPDIVPRVAQVKAEVVVDASGGETFDTFNSFRERFITFALVDESKKANRLPLLLPREAFDPPVISQPEPVQLPPVKPQPPAKPTLKAWVIALVVVVLLSIVFAFIIIRASSLHPLAARFLSRGRRQTNVNTSSFTRPADKPSPRRQREIAGSDGAGNQQSHIPARHIYDWSGRTYERGHADHPHPFADRRDDTGALGAWARSRGLRAEASARGADVASAALARGDVSNQSERDDGNRPASFGWFGKRLANFARR